jgi:uncharacterized Zn finger protein
MKPSSTFSSLLHRSNLRRMAGAASFERGEYYFASNYVERLNEERRDRWIIRAPAQ